MAIAQLSIDLVAKVATFEKDLKRATTATQQQTRLMSNALDSVKGAVVGMAGAFTVGFAVNFIKSAIDSIDALNDLKDATGASVENLSALEDIAARTGTKFESVGAAMVKFNGALKDAKPGSDAALALEALGLSVQELKNMDPAEALLKTATALSKFADDGNKARLVQELFGKSMREVAPFLKDLAEKGQLNATVTTEQAQAAEKFNKELFSMQKNVQDIGRSLAGPMVTGFNSFIEKLKEAKKEGRGLFTSMESLRKNELERIAQTKRIAEHVGNAGRGSVNPESVSPSLPDALIKAEKAGSSKSVSVEKINEASRSLSAYIDGLQRNLQKNDELTESEKALNYLRTLGTSGQIPQVRELVMGLAEEIDKEKELTEVLKLKREATIAAGDAVSKGNEEYQALLSRLLAATPSAHLESQRKDVRALTDEFTAGRIAESTYLEAVTARLDLTGDKLEKTKSAAEELGMVFESAFEDAILSGKDLSTVIDGLIQDMLRMSLRKTVTEPLANYFSGMLGGLLSFDGGGSTPGGARSGGVDGKGGFLSVLHPNETVIDHTKGQKSGGSVTVYQNFTVGDVASVSMVRQAVAGSERRIAAGMGRSMNYGGALS